MGIKNIIKSFAHEKGIIVGVCDAEPLEISESAEHTPFFHYKPEVRANPSKMLTDARSIIVIGVGYNRELAFELDDEPRGRFSLGAVGLDYHYTLMGILDELETRLRLAGYVFECVKSVDTGPLPEKKLALKANLGWISRKGLVVSEKFGSFFNIGYMVTTLLVEPWVDLNFEEGDCGDCGICAAACPGRAIGGDSPYRYRECISFLTQKKGALSADERRVMGSWLYGCDVCQKVCPYNANTYAGKIESIDAVMPRLDDILNLDKKEFNARYKSTAIYWRGLANLKRNAAVALENWGKR